MNTKTSPVQSVECKICQTQIEHFNLGVQICRACSQFWRRAVNENLQFVCRNNEKCDVANTKFKCKFCRFKMIEKLGARFTNQNASKSNQSNGKVTNSISSSFVDVTSMPTQNSPTGSHLESLVQGYEQVLAGQRALFVAEYPEFGFSDNQFIMPKELKIMKMNKSTVPLWHAMFVDRLGPYNELSSKQKINVVASSIHDLTLLNQAWLTAKHFPDLSDRRVMISNGYYVLMDILVWPEFVEDNISPEKMPEIQRAAEVMFEKTLKNVRKFKLLNVRKVDVVVLILLSICKHLERSNCMTDQIESFKEEVLAEWSLSLRNEFGANEGSRQMGRIIAYHIDSDMENPENWYKCLVCGELTRFYHLNAQICRPCASFMRRVHTESLDYVCKYDGKCALDQSRTACKSCRIKLIKEAGASIELKDNPPTDIPQLTSTKKDAAKCLKLKQVLSGYEEYLIAQRSVLIQITPELSFDENAAIPAQKKLLNEAEKRSLPLLIRMFNENFGPFRDLPKKIKIKMIMDVMQDFGVFNRAWLTHKYFPTDNTRLMFLNGYYVPFVNSVDMFEWFFRDFVEHSHINNYLAVICPLIRKYMRNCIRFRNLECRQIDIAAMIFLALWKRIEYANYMTDELAAYKDSLIVEWIADLRKHWGSKKGIQQFTNLMTFYVSCDDITTEVKNAMTVLRVKDLRDEEDEMCDLDKHLTKLNLDVDNEIN
ncbi:Nuclear receptor [Aphelenchoides besseyi]|nr:Nuclear receptor [Aphelenchoides besseyi]